MKRFTPIIYAYLEQEETAGRISCAASVRCTGTIFTSWS